ncbi:MAG: hypothetical protein EA397_14165 [Deltaproteobacteria bacterium]|nr:MAG: hypothetical protein EA397_14165 [Deltaproteobacteria bacterium]
MKLLSGTLYASALLALIAGCQRRAEDPDTPRFFTIQRSFDGPSGTGFGAALAFDAEGELWIGAPYAIEGGLFQREEQVLPGMEGAFVGASILLTPQVQVAAPGLSQLLDPQGNRIWQGDPAQREGQRAVWTPDGLASLRHDGVSGAGGFASSAPLWSLAVLKHRRGHSLIAGRVGGGLAHADGVVVGSRALGRGLHACDLTGDGREELIVGDPVRGWVQIHEVRRAQDLADLSLAHPTVRHDLGRGAGMSFACVGRGLLVGAPDRRGGGGVAWLSTPMEPSSHIEWIEGLAGIYAGHALAADGLRVAVGDPGGDQVHLLQGMP